MVKDFKKKFGLLNNKNIIIPEDVQIEDIVKTDRDNFIGISNSHKAGEGLLNKHSENI